MIEDADMQKLVESIEKLEKRITNIETGKVGFDKGSTKIVTTEDIQIPENWEMNPLTKVPSDPESIIVLMKWLQYLVDKCGHSYLSEILDYYVDIGWISEDAKISLLDYSNGITEESESGETVRKGVSNLPSKDHIQSLIFIQKLKGIKFDKHFIDRIDGELARITKKLDNYRFK
jgi:flagellar protein FlaD